MAKRATPIALVRRWASIKETANYLGLDEKSVRNMIRDGRLVGYRNGSHIVRTDLNEVDASFTRVRPVLA